MQKLPAHGISLQFLDDGRLGVAAAALQVEGEYRPPDVAFLHDMLEIPGNDGQHDRRRGRPVKHGGDHALPSQSAGGAVARRRPKRSAQF